jgi:hypothetical protein
VGRRQPSRSYERITKRDLARLADIARADREGIFERNPRWALDRKRLLCVALCQGAALHFVDGKNGVKDFDVWTFFSASPKRPYPDPSLYHRIRHVDYGESRFGARDDNRFPGYEGRSVDLLSDSLPVGPSADPIKAIQDWLSRPTRDSPRFLAQKAVVLIDPPPLRGRVAWKPSSS